jgi:hypothetical protein
MAARYGARTPVPDCHARLVCSRCGSRRVDMVVTETERRTCPGILAPLKRAETFGII